MTPVPAVPAAAAYGMRPSPGTTASGSQGHFPEQTHHQWRRGEEYRGPVPGEGVCVCVCGGGGGTAVIYNLTKNTFEVWLTKLHVHTITSTSPLSNKAFTLQVHILQCHHILHIMHPCTTHMLHNTCHTFHMMHTSLPLPLNPHILI